MNDDLLAEAILGELWQRHSNLADIDALTLTLVEIVNDHNRERDRQLEAAQAVLAEVAKAEPPERADYGALIRRSLVDRAGAWLISVASIPSTPEPDDA